MKSLIQHLNTNPSEFDLSPSKARLHASNQHTWAITTNWLKELYSTSTSTHLSSEFTTDTQSALRLNSVVPPFEKNDETLAALQAVMNANRKANELRTLIHEARSETLRVVYGDDMHSHGSDIEEDVADSMVETERGVEKLHVDENGNSEEMKTYRILRDLETALSEIPQPTGYNMRGGTRGAKQRALKPQDNDTPPLEALARSSILLGTMPSHSISITRQSSTSETMSSNLASTLAIKLIDLTRQTFDLHNQLSQIETLKSSLEQEIQTTKTAIDKLKLEGSHTNTEPDPDSFHDVYTDPLKTRSNDNLHAQTAQWNREIKQINLKINEYQSRITALEHTFITTTGPTSHSTQTGKDITFSRVLEKRKALETKKSEMSILENELGLFHGLPPDIALSRTEVKRAQAELDTWKKRREELFQKFGQ